MNPYDPSLVWLHAAEMAACLKEACRWKWSEDLQAVSAAADELAGLVYEGSTDQQRLLALTEQVNDGLDRENLIALWLVGISARFDPEQLVSQARTAFHYLRYILFDERRDAA